MARTTRSQRLNGLFPLSYMGVIPTSPPNFIIENRAPTINDSKNFYIGDIWLNNINAPTPPDTADIWMLVALVGNQATWVNFGAGDLESLSGNIGTNPVFPDVSGNINVFGDGTTVNVSGDGINTLTVSTGGTVATSYVTDAGTAIPATGILEIIADTVVVNCGSSVFFDGSGNTVRLNVTDPQNNTFIGKNAGNLTFTTTATSTGVGAGVLSAITTGDSNTAIGAGSLNAATTSGINCAMGNFALGALDTGNGRNVAIGFTSASGLTSGDNNVIVGYNAASNYNSSESNNIIIGASNAGAVGESDVIRIGFNFAVNQNILIGTGSGGSIDNTSIDNCIVGCNAGSNYSGSESSNIIIGAQQNGQAGESNIIRIGTSGAAHEDDNIFIGQDSGNTSYTIGVATGNTCVGANSGLSLTTSDGNTLIGSDAGLSLTSGVDNTAVGRSALRSFTAGAADAGANTAIGRQSLRFVTTGIQNCGIGDSAGNNGTTGVTTGSYNTFMGGTGVGANYTSTESSNILIGNAVSGTLGESNTIRVGTSGAGTSQQNKCFIAGIRGITTGVADAVAVLIDSADQLGTVSSSLRYKENIEDLNEDSSIIYQLRPVKFNYKKHPEVPAWGLIAEEVDKVFPQLVVYNNEGLPETVKYHELSILLLNEIKNLKDRIDRIEQ